MRLEILEANRNIPVNKNARINCELTHCSDLDVPYTTFEANFYVRDADQIIGMIKAEFDLEFFRSWHNQRHVSAKNMLVDAYYARRDVKSQGLCNWHNAT